MTDINKQIEEAREYRRSLIRRIRLNKANIDYILENGTINGSLMLDIDKAMIDYHAYSYRWRLVSEEMPEENESLYTEGNRTALKGRKLGMIKTKQVIIEYRNGTCEVSERCKCANDDYYFWSANESFADNDPLNIIRWKPID